ALDCWLHQQPPFVSWYAPPHVGIPEDLGVGLIPDSLRVRQHVGAVSCQAVPRPPGWGGPVFSWPFAVGSPPVWPGCLRQPRLGARCVSGSVAAPLVLGWCWQVPHLTSAAGGLVLAGMVVGYGRGGLGGLGDGGLGDGHRVAAGTAGSQWR